MSESEDRQFSVLIVDDIPKNIQVLGNMLRGAGYSISFATSGTQAVEMIQSYCFDLVLLDVMMPDMDGFEVCKRLREIPEWKEIPVIFLTAKTSGEDIVKGFRMGAVDYVTKPFNSAELLARVGTHLELKSTRDRVARANRELAEKNEELSRLNEQLQKALLEIKTLQGIVPICSNCKRIRKEGAPAQVQSSWVPLEIYIRDHTQAEFSHSICPECAKLLYPAFSFE